MPAILPLVAGLFALTVGDAELPAVSPRAAEVRPIPCAGAERRQFDFWLGDWDVRTPDGKVAGSNRISPVLGGCALREEWTGASGSRGTSLNVFDSDARRWRQTWVDDKGNVLLLTGGYRNGKMILEGDGPGSRRGARVRNRITWTPLSDGRVRQLWESSADGGRSWNTAFDGTYAKRSQNS
jgi:hypothetical protein